LYLDSEYLAYDSAKQTLQARIAQVRQGSYSRFLPRFELLAAAILDSEPRNERAYLRRVIG
jgi:hypothetical protein